MSFLDKIKSFFSKKENQVETVEVQQVPETQIANCFLCQEPILEGDRTKEVPIGEEKGLVHKRCFKKTQKAVLAGQNPQEVWSERRE